MWRRRRYKTLRRREENDDEPAVSTIPYIPDNVIEKILSFLPVRDAALATAVSKQWSSLWPSFSVIDIEQKRFREPRRFLGFLRYSLRRCRDQRHLDKLRIQANLRYGAGLVREWVDFAIERCVKELDLHDLDEKNKLHKNLLISHYVLTLQCLTSLNLENVRLYASTEISGPVSLPLLKTMSLTEVTFIDDVEDRATWAIPSLILGCPSIEHLSIVRCTLGYSTLNLEISSDSLKSLEIMRCHSLDIAVTAKNLESFTFYSDCICPDHKAMFLWECDSLKYVDISCNGLRHLLLHNCLETMENSVHTPNLESFEFSGYLKAKVNFVEAPVDLLKAIIRIWKTEWHIEYYSAMRDFLESFDCSKIVKIHIEDSEGVIIPESCRMGWSPPLPSIQQLELFSTSPLGNGKYCLRLSLHWIAPSAQILQFLDVGDYYDDEEYAWMTPSAGILPIVDSDDDNNDANNDGDGDDYDDED